MDPERTPASASHARLARLVRGTYLAGLAATIVWLAATRGAEVVELLQRARPLPIAAALAATFVLIGLSALFWAQALRMLGHRSRISQIVLATARALPARYVPLGVSFAAARIALLRARGVGLAPLMTTAALETVMRPTVALTMGATLLAASGSPAGSLSWPVATLAVAAVAATPVAGGKVLTRLAARRGIALAITWKGYARLVVAEAAYWAWASMTFVLYLQAFPSADSFGELHAAGAFMVAWALGFLAVFAPQGIGVAEISLVGLLAAGDGEPGIAMTAVFASYRLVQVARDILATATAEVIAKRRARQGSAPTG